jgi:DNA primase
MNISQKLLEAFLEEEYGNAIFKNGYEWQLPSIANPNKKRKLYVNVDKGVAHDFIGGEGYNAAKLIKTVKGFKDYSEVESYLTELIMKNNFSMDNLLVSSPSVVQEYVPPEPKIFSEIDMPKGVVDILDVECTITKQAKEYLYSRGFDDKDIRKYHFKVGIDGEYMERIIVPFIEDNKIVWFQGRHLIPNHYMRYLNPESVEKSMLVYNIDNLQENGIGIIVEGPFDAATVNGQAIMGSTISEWQIRKILNKKPDRLVVVPDNDEGKVVKGIKIKPGYIGALKTIEGLIKAGYPKDKIMVAFIHDGKDLNSLGKAKAAEVLYAAQPLSTTVLLQFQLNGCSNPYLNNII